MKFTTSTDGSGHRCTWCDEPTDCNIVIAIDAAGVKHRFHVDCWEEHKQFMVVSK